MPQKIHYQDDLFILSTIVKGLEACLLVEADPEFFAERVAGEVLFLDEKIRYFAEILLQNGHLIERLEYLKLLERTGKLFLSCLERIASKDCAIGREISSNAIRFEAMRQSLRARLSEIGNALRTAVEGESETDLVSSDELSELLRD
jgi:hypothetical protein